MRWVSDVSMSRYHTGKVSWKHFFCIYADVWGHVISSLRMKIQHYWMKKETEIKKYNKKYNNQSLTANDISKCNSRIFRQMKF